MASSSRSASPIDIATKINALQELSGLPLLMSADLETGVGFRARGGYFLPNAIDLGGATHVPVADGAGRGEGHGARVRDGEGDRARGAGRWASTSRSGRCST